MLIIQDFSPKSEILHDPYFGLYLCIAMSQVIQGGNKMKYVLLTLTTLLVMGSGLSYAADIAFYTYTEGAVENVDAETVDTIKGVVEGLFKEVVVFDSDGFDALEAWAEANLDDGELDIIRLSSGSLRKNGS